MESTQANKAKVMVGTVIQISPECGTFGHGCYAEVIAVETWGVQCMVPIPGQRDGPMSAGQSRVMWADLEIIGERVWDTAGNRSAVVPSMRHHP